MVVIFDFFTLFLSSILLFIIESILVLIIRYKLSNYDQFSQDYYLMLIQRLEFTHVLVLLIVYLSALYFAYIWQPFIIIILALQLVSVAVDIVIMKRVFNDLD